MGRGQMAGNPRECEATQPGRRWRDTHKTWKLTEMALRIHTQEAELDFGKRGEHQVCLTAPQPMAGVGERARQWVAEALLHTRGNFKFIKYRGAFYLLYILIKLEGGKEH